jgi:hypothetical protein
MIAGTHLDGISVRPVSPRPELSRQVQDDSLLQSYPVKSLARVPMNGEYLGRATSNTQLKI